MPAEKRWRGVSLHTEFKTLTWISNHNDYVWPFDGLNGEHWEDIVKIENVPSYSINIWIFFFYFLYASRDHPNQEHAFAPCPSLPVQRDPFVHVTQGVCLWK